MKLVLIKWEDAHGSDGWQPLSTIKKKAAPLMCRSVGWVVAKTRGHTVLTNARSNEHLGDAGDGNGHFTIPNACIRKVTVLRKNG